MGEVQLDHIEAGFVRHLGGTREGVAHLVHVGAVHGARGLAAFRERDRRGREDLPVRGFAEIFMAFPGARQRALAAGMGELHRDLGGAVLVDEIGDAFPRADMLGRIHPGAMQADAAFRQHVGHLGDHEPGAADRAAAEMHEMPVVHGAVLGRIHAHRRHHDAIRDGEAAQRDRREHRRRRAVAAAVGLGATTASTLRTNSGAAFSTRA